MSSIPLVNSALACLLSFTLSHSLLSLLDPPHWPPFCSWNAFNALYLGPLYVLFPLPWFSPHPHLPCFILHVACIFFSSSLRSSITSSERSFPHDLSKVVLPAPPPYFLTKERIPFISLITASHYVVHFCDGMIFEVLITSHSFTLPSPNPQKTQSYNCLREKRGETGNEDK